MVSGLDSGRGDLILCVVTVRSAPHACIAICGNGNMESYGLVYDRLLQYETIADGLAYWLGVDQGANIVSLTSRITKSKRHRIIRR